MAYVLNHWIWLGLGLLLILLEFFLPGLVVIFLGLGAVLTAAMLYARVLTDAYLTVVFFTVTSVFLLLTLRRIILFFYPAYSEKSETDEDLLIAGQLAGARWGLAGIPESWVGRITSGERIAAIAGRLFDAATGAGPATP